MERVQIKSKDILEICPTNNHERTSFIVDQKMVNQLISFYEK